MHPGTVAAGVVAPLAVGATIRVGDGDSLDAETTYVVRDGSRDTVVDPETVLSAPGQ
jgi:hypothetical protein